MIFRNVFWCSMLIVFGATPLASGESLDPGNHAALLKEAVEAIESDFERNWAFTETSITAEGTTVGRFDPRLPEDTRWALLSVDDRDPTSDEIDDYLADKEDKNGNRENSDDADDADQKDSEVGNMISPDSLRLIEETDNFWLFSFIPNDDEDERKFMEHVDGTLTISKGGRYLQEINMQSREPFKPRFGVKINDFLTRLRFAPAADQGPIVPLSIDFRIDVRAFMVKRVRESAEISFSDYEYVGN
jgi:hypothetical protein